ncbi:baseplate J/gp47 family protein [Salmonella enterica]|nr:baseplate J/gp47 family protein [Salmonella enterica]EAS0615255.1 baseplate J/gp47 family protein [Salmonella enterica subsp. enterica serovar Dahomey]ECS6493632.1 baseplate J/gp47 family protein [Salmonella enterica subsp. enterica serovar Herston]EDT5578210.1 baseplate J/gp47 family protein [Salmonella enterica subsp. enterica serovar Kokomlemle]EHC6688439.1 baseplate J/gp47 family protein [Salmonella enterica subsp. enterica]
MPYQPTPLAQLINQTQQDISQRLEGTLPGLDETTLHAIGYAQAGLSAQEQEHLAWIARQIIPSDADEAELLKHCAWWGIVRKPASRAGGPVQLTLTDTATADAGTQLQRGDGVIYQITTSEKAPAGTLEVEVVAMDAGAAGNAPAGTLLTFITPQAGIVQTATVTGSGITGGADVESISELLSRLVFRVQYPPSGGTKYDFERWAREVPGVTRAWCLPEWPQAGSLGVTFVLDNNPDIFPGEGDVARVAEYIKSHPDPATGQPVGQALGPVVKVFKLTNHPVAFQIKIAPNTPENQQAVRQALTDLLYNEARPGGIILPSAFWRAVAGVKVLDDFELRSPLESVSAGAMELLTVGEIAWL